MDFKKLVLAGAIAVGLCSAATAAETLRFSSFEPPVAHVTKNILIPWAEDVTTASNGELEIQMFPGGTLGRSPAQQLKLVEDGVADIAWVIPGYTPGRFDQGTVSELPFLIPSSAAGSAAMWSMYEQGFFTGDYDKFKLIGIMVSAPNGLATVAEIKSPSDLKGLNLRAPGPTMLSAIDALGAVPVGGITGPTIAESMSRGLIDGTFTQWGAIETFRMGEVMKNYLDLTLGATPMLIVMNKARYDGLSDAAKAALDKFSGAAFSERFGKSFDANVAEARERNLAAHSIQELVPDEALAKEWRDAMAVATADWIAGNENGQAIYDALTKAIADASN